MMYPWYRDTQIGVGQYSSPVTAAIKTETGYADCMLSLDYAVSSGALSKVSKFPRNFRWIPVNPPIRLWNLAICCISFVILRSQWEKKCCGFCTTLRMHWYESLHFDFR